MHTNGRPKMARTAAGLTVKKIEALKKVGLHGDGNGLFLQVSASGTKSWVCRYKVGTKTRNMGVGSVAIVTLAEARTMALEIRKLVAAGRDPIAERDAAKAAAAAPVTVMTFERAAEAYIAAKAPEWRSAKHEAQWTATLKAYAYPVFAAHPVAAIDRAMVLRVLEPIWSEIPETASRVRGRIESILDWATVSGHRTGDNPARWKGNLQHSLAARGKVAKVEHHAALPFADLPDFMTRLRAADGNAARALRFAILTAARTGEVLGATWPEIDLEAAVWTVPSERMKAGQEHRVALSEPALALLREMATIRQGDYVFGGARAGKPLSSMALLMCLRRAGRPDLTTHGFRSTFSDWSYAAAGAPAEVIEKSLAHTVGTKVARAYFRDDLLDKRRDHMRAWAEFAGA